MLAFQAFDTQPVVIPHEYVQGKFEGTPTLSIENHLFEFQQTPIHNIGLGLILRVSTNKTPVSTDPEINNPTNSVFQEAEQFAEPDINPEVIAARNARLSLLVQKFEGDSDRESDARLEILTQRLRRLNPVITPEILNVFTTLTTNLESISSNIDQLSDRFGLI